MDQAKYEKEELRIPNIGNYSYLVDALFDCGPTVRSSIGEDPLDWTDVMAWHESSGVLTDHWERRMLIEMSLEYLLGKQDGAEVLAVPPMDVTDG